MHIPFPQLRQRPGAPEAEEVWLRGTAGEPGYLTGKDAEAAACDAVAVPVVTGHADMRVVDKIIALALAAAGITLDGADPGPADEADDDGPDHRTASNRDEAAARRRGSPSWGTAGGASGRPGRVPRPAPGPGAVHPRRRPGAAVRHRPARHQLRLRPRRAGRLAAHHPARPPYSTPSVPLDIGYSDSIPASIRRAVLLRDRGCAWPRCGGRRLVRRASPAAQKGRREDRRQRVRAAVPVPSVRHEALLSSSVFRMGVETAVSLPSQRRGEAGRQPEPRVGGEGGSSLDEVALAWYCRTGRAR